MAYSLSALAVMLFMASGTAGARTGNKALMLTVSGTSTEASATFDELLPLAQKRFPEHGQDAVRAYRGHPKRQTHRVVGA